MDSLAPSYQAPNAQLYQPLSHADSVRVLTVFESDNEDDDIECHLAETRLSEVSNEGEGYTALSYAWDDLRFTHEIWVGDQRLLIDANLDSALRHLRRRDSPIRLWVDAVCINQADLVEKNHQVQQMRSIFSDASETIIWLGPSSGNTSVSAWNFLERHSSWALNDRQERDHALPAKLEEDLLSFRGEFRDVEIDVLSRPWFKRLWVFQEAVLSRILSIQCGHRRIAWDDFSKTVLQAKRHHDRYGFSTWDDGKRGMVEDITRARNDHLQKLDLDESSPSSEMPGESSTPRRALNILSLLQRGRYLEASDAKDKIFGFMAIAEGIDTNDPRFQVDYGLKTRRLYIQFAKNMVEATASLDILSYVNLSDPRGPVAKVKLPSWVPCWAYRSRFAHRGVHRCIRTILDTLPTEPDEGVNARRNRVSNSHITWSHHNSESASSDSMEVSGRVVGRISAVTGRIGLSTNEQVLFESLADLPDLGDEDEKTFILVMALWARILTTPRYFHAKTNMDFIDRARIDGVPWEELEQTDKNHQKDFRGLRLHLKQATMDDPKLLVQEHLYRRGQAGSKRTRPNLDRDVPMSMIRVTDDDSILNGRKLTVVLDGTTSHTDAAEQAPGQLALVPGAAHEGDLVIQISGARVPFVIRKRQIDWADLDDSWVVVPPIQGDHTKVGKSQGVQWELIGDCLLNGFEELAEDDMDSRFRLV